MQRVRHPEWFDVLSEDRVQLVRLTHTFCVSQGLPDVLSESPHYYRNVLRGALQLDGIPAPETALLDFPFAVRGRLFVLDRGDPDAERHLSEFGRSVGVVVTRSRARVFSFREIPVLVPTALQKHWADNLLARILKGELSPEGYDFHGYKVRFAPIIGEGMRFTQNPVGTHQDRRLYPGCEKPQRGLTKVDLDLEILEGKRPCPEGYRFGVYTEAK